MKTRKAIVEIICLVLLLNFFYEGIYKVAYWQNYSFWVKHAPLLSPAWQILAYVIPLGEIGLAIGLLVPSFRVKALYTSLGVLIVFVCWIMSVYLFTHRLFWPYHALWEKPTWMQKLLISVGMCWMAFAAIILSKVGLSFKGAASSDAVSRNPANSQ